MSCALVAVAQPLLHAETYVIKKLTTPTVRINDQDMKVGDTFTDGAVVYWSSERQAMRVMNSRNEPIYLRATGDKKPARVRTLVAGLGKLSARATCTSLADHRQAFEGVNGRPNEIIDSISVTSGWKLDDNNYFEMSVPTEKGKRVVRLPFNDKGEVLFARDMFPMANDKDEVEVTVEVTYVNGRRGETRLITDSMRVLILPITPDE